MASLAAVPFAGVGRSFLSATAGETPRIVEALEAPSGPCVIALPQTGHVTESWFSGQFVDEATRRQFQVTATEEACDDCMCAPNNDYSHVRLRFRESATRSSAFARVSVTGGDFVRLEALDAAGCAFEPARLLSGDRAEAGLKSYFPRLVAERDAARAAGRDDADLLLVVGVLTCTQLLLTGNGRSGAAPPR